MGGQVPPPTGTKQPPVLVGMNIALSEWCPRGKGANFRARPPMTGIGVPGRVFPSKNWTVPTALKGDTREMSISGMNVNPGLRATRNVVIVGVIPLAGGVGVGVDGLGVDEG